MRSAVSGMAWSFGQDSLPSDKRLFRLARLTADENYSFFPSIALISQARANVQ